VFGIFKKKAAPPKPADPLAVFDAVIASLERQGAEVRKSAATLLALRAELARDELKYEKRITTTKERLDKAVGEVKAAKTLQRDISEAQQLLNSTREAHAQAEANARLLMDAAEELSRQLAELQEERQSARARLSAGVMVSEALKTQVANFDRVMKLDKARDEVEKAHALAELYREDAGK
jgi:chromosome segregation ATPase